MMRRILLLVLAACLLSLAGCQQLAWVLYVFAPDPADKKIPAEFDGLEGRTVAVVVYAEPSTMFDYPFLRLELSSMIGSELKKNLKSVTIVDARRIVKLQDERIDWEMMGKTELAKSLGADYVLYVAVVEFTTHDPGSVGIFRGQARVEAGLYGASRAESVSRVWYRQDILAAYPKDALMGQPAEDDTKVRIGTLEQLANDISKRFYEHKEKAKTE